MKWRTILKQHGQVFTETGTDVDPFALLAQQAKDRGEPTSTISCKTSIGYAEVSFMVTITCPQDEASINLAGDLTLRKSVELANYGAAHLGLPQVPEPT